MINTLPIPKTKKAQRQQQRRLEVIEGYGGSCFCCGEEELAFLSIDHVGGWGKNDPNRLSAYTMYSHIIRSDFPPEYRILCHNCNQAIGFYGECPHKNPRLRGAVLRKKAH